MKKLFPLMLLLLCNTCFAAKVTGEVSKLRVFKTDYQSYKGGGTGMLTFYMDNLSGACGSSEKRVAISTDHPLYDTVLSMVLTAKVSKSSVTVTHLDTCSQRNNAWDFGFMDIN